MKFPTIGSRPVNNRSLFSCLMAGDFFTAGTPRSVSNLSDVSTAAVSARSVTASRAPSARLTSARSRTDSAGLEKYTVSNKRSCTCEVVTSYSDDDVIAKSCCCIIVFVVVVVYTMAPRSWKPEVSVDEAGASDAQSQLQAEETQRVALELQALTEGGN